MEKLIFLLFAFLIMVGCSQKQQIIIPQPTSFCGIKFSNDTLATKEARKFDGTFMYGPSEISISKEFNEISDEHGTKTRKCILTGIRIKKACMEGYTAYNLTCQDLMEKPKKAKQQNRLSRKIRALCKPGILAIDEIGYQNLTTEEAPLLYL